MNAYEVLKERGFIEQLTHEEEIKALFEKGGVTFYIGIDPTADSRFVKNGNTVLDALAGFYVTGGGFRHTAGGERNGMATEQGYYALAAYYRFVNAQTRLYDMTDVTIQTGGSNTPATGDTGVLVWVIALPVAALAATFVLKRKEREA